MLIAGIDLAAEPTGTALCLISWSKKSAEVAVLKTDLDDNQLVSESLVAKKIGIDCAFGWPLKFANFIANHSVQTIESQSFKGDMASRRELSFRETDRITREITGRWPLSVSTDRLGLTAMRCTGLLNRFRAAGKGVNRAGLEDVVEIYPAAALRIWNFETKDYRKSPFVREELLNAMCERAPWLDLGATRALLIESCDAFDALIAAFATRAVVMGQSTKVPEDLMDIAEIEGWLYLPNASFEQLIG